MIFNSFAFLFLFVTVFIVYYFPLKGNTKAQNWLLLLSSYFFYGYADWKMIPLLLVATWSIFCIGKAIYTSTNPKKSSLLTTLGVSIGVGLLAYFKYFNFFIASFSSALKVIGLQSNLGTFDIIMPLGISYFTFKLISYIIEIQRGKIEYCTDFVAFSTYIAFFPTILSGPIDRPNTFIPQLQKKRAFDYALAVTGCRQILWGLFQKIVIADNLTRPIHGVWSDIPNQTGGTLFMVAILYSVQVYHDFSGYSNIAIGMGKILGFQITKNFNYPYFSRNLAEFWRKWHISLTSWVTDYVFMPLNIRFRNWGKFGLLLAIMINMIVVGIWHGANWTFVVFGVYNGLLFIPLVFGGRFFGKKKLKTDENGLPSLMDFVRILATFTLITFGFILIRAENVAQAYQFAAGILSPSFAALQPIEGLQKLPFLAAFLTFFVEWNSREMEYPTANLGSKFKRPHRYLIYYALLILIFWCATGTQEFIYFKF